MDGKRQFDLWLEAQQRRAVVETRIRELENEMCYLNDIIETLRPKDSDLSPKAQKVYEDIMRELATSDDNDEL